jgi:hypothetical protein
MAREPSIRGRQRVPFWEASRHTALFFRMSVQDAYFEQGAYLLILGSAQSVWAQQDKRTSSVDQSR